MKFFLKSAVGGSTAAGIDFLILFLLVHYGGTYYLIATNIAFVCAVIVNFSIQKYWTFEKKDIALIHIQFFKFITISALNMGLNSLCMYLLVDTLSVHYLLSKIIISLALSVMNFLFYRHFIFKT